MWRCKECGEKSEHIFLNCWNCNLPRSGTCDFGQLIQWCDSDIDRAKIHSKSSSKTNQNRVLVKAAAKPVYRLVKILSQSAMALTIFAFAFMVCGLAITAIYCSTRKMELISFASVLVVGSFLTFVAVRISVQSFIIKMTMHLLLHVAPDLRNECVAIHEKAKNS